MSAGAEPSRSSAGTIDAYGCTTLVSCPHLCIRVHGAAKHLADHKPVKLAAAEGLFETQRSAPLVLFGVPNVEERRLDYSFHVPKALSILAQGGPDAEVRGLDATPRELWPSVTLVFVAFHVMIGCGFALSQPVCVVVGRTVAGGDGRLRVRDAGAASRTAARPCEVDRGRAGRAGRRRLGLRHRGHFLLPDVSLARASAHPELCPR